MTKVIPEGSLDAPLARGNYTFKNNLRVGGHAHVQRLRANHGNALSPEESCESDLIDILGQRKNRRHHQDRIGTDNYSNLQILSLLFCLPVMAAATLHALPMHSGGISAENLEAIQPEIADTRARVVRDHHAERDEASAIARPAFEDGK